MGLKKMPNEEKSVEQIVDEIEKEEEPKVSQLVTDEDGYSEEIPMLAGYVDDKGVLHDTFRFREMDGRDEEAINKQDVRNNGAKVMNIVVERCVVQIGTLTKKAVGAIEWHKIIQKLLGGDIDYMAIKIREYSKGSDIEFRHKCPNCGAKLTSYVDSNEFAIKEFQGLREIPFSLSKGYKDKNGNIHTDGVIRLLNGEDREIITPQIKKNPASALTSILARTCEFNDGFKVTNEVMSCLTVRDREYLQKLLTENVFGIDTTVELQCSCCGADITGEVQTANFL